MNLDSGLHLPRHIVNALLEHAHREAPNECCGFLAGRNGVASHCVPIINELASPIAFRTEARSTLAAFRFLREHDLDLVALYHSHPLSDCFPSRRDLEDNTYGEEIPWLILDTAGEMRLWRLHPVMFGPLPLTFDSE